MYLSKVLKSKIYFLIISFLITLNVNAELIKPNNGIEPYQVVKIQLRSLKKNDDPKKDNGIEQTWEFAHPSNQKNTGPLNRFKTMIKGKSYTMLLNHLDHKVIEVKSTDLKALFEVTILERIRPIISLIGQLKNTSQMGH